MQKSLALILTFSLLLQMMLPLVAVAQTSETFARITAKSLNVRSGPGTTFEVVGKVTVGMELLTLRQEAGWVQIELPTGATGWVSNRYVELMEVLVTRQEDSPAPPQTTGRTQEPVQVRSSANPSEGGGFGRIIKWTCFVGAGALGGLAFYERSQGNDTYDEYEQFVLAGDDDEAEVKWNETGDHDDKAQLYGIAAGSLFGIFLLQQFVFGRGGNNYDVTSRDPLPLSYNPQTHEIRATLTLARF